MWNGRLPADGGLLEPAPITPALSAQADAVVAVSLIGERRWLPGEAPERETGDDRRAAEWQDRLRRSAAQFTEIDALSRQSSDSDRRRTNPLCVKGRLRAVPGRGGQATRQRRP